MKISFGSKTRMQCLLSVIEGEAKQSVEAIVHNGIFYATAVKSFKRDFGSTTNQTQQQDRSTALPSAS